MIFPLWAQLNPAAADGWCDLAERLGAQAEQLGVPVSGGRT